jgi:4-hydroxy-tetrahydrodipicolinate synthase
MPSARDARDWASSGGLHGIGDSLYTPFSGPDGDGIDWDAYRTLVRYCVGDLGHAMLWLTSGIAEWWSLTNEERKQLLEVAVREARAVAPSTVIQACTSALSAKEAVDLTLHAQENGADIAYLQTPPMEVHGGEGVRRFFEYVAARTDIALGVFNSPSSGYVLTPQEVAAIYEAVPAVVAIKEGVMQPWRSAAIHQLAPAMQVWECDTIVYRAGWLQKGIVTPAQLGTSGYLFETPDQKYLTEYWTLVWDGQLAEAIEYADRTGMDEMLGAVAGWFVSYPGRADYFTHWGAAFRYAASCVGLPVGDYGESRPPQGLLPDAARQQIRAAYAKAGLLRELTPA